MVKCDERHFSTASCVAVVEFNLGQLERTECLARGKLGNLVWAYELRAQAEHEAID